MKSILFGNVLAMLTTLGRVDRECMLHHAVTA